MPARQQAVKSEVSQAFIQADSNSDGLLDKTDLAIFLRLIKDKLDSRGVPEADHATASD